MDHTKDLPARRVAGRALIGSALIGIIVGLAACGGGGDTTSAPTGGGEDLASRNFLPMAVGDRWFYDESGSSQTVLIRSTGTRALASGTGVVSTSSALTGQDTVRLADSTGVYEFPGTNADALTQALGRIRRLKYPLLVGDNFVQADKSLGATFDFDFDGIGDVATLHSSVQVVALEDVDSDLGRFAGCLHTRTTNVLTVRLSWSGRVGVGMLVTDDWMAPGIGVVRSHQTSTTDGTVTWDATRTIRSYGVGGQRSETVPPVASAAALERAIPLGPPAKVDVTFSEAMDNESLLDVLQVTDAAGQSVPGTVSVDEAGLHFLPSAPWAMGDYMARLSNTATDLVGNPLAAARSWTFTIDATAPALIGSQPLSGTVDVPLASQIVLHFSEAVAPDSVNASTIYAIFDGARLSALQYSVSGADVTLTPQQPLARGKSYVISIGAVTDLAGNALSAAQVSFLTDPGRFGAPIVLWANSNADRVGSMMTAGDLNGDGRNDVAADRLTFQDGSTPGWQGSVMVYAQQSDGTRDAGTQIPLQAGCTVTSLAIGDVTGDGRNDLVVAEGGTCGIEIFRQTAQGPLVLHQQLAVSSAALMKLADLNGDARLDLVTFGNNQIEVRLNLPGGWSLNDSVTVATYPAAWDLAVGDLNGDGQPDIAFTNEFNDNNASAGVLFQQPGGHLSGPVWVTDDSHWSTFSIAIGDIDRDGRADLLVAQQTGVKAFRQLADSTLDAAQLISSDANDPLAMKLADLNGDGRLDIVTGRDLAVCLQNTDGTFLPQAVYPGNIDGGANNPGKRFIADLNGDGLPDVLQNGLIFIQRPVRVMSEALRRTDPAGATSLVGWMKSTFRTNPKIR